MREKGGLPPTKWGHWTFDRDRLVLEHDDYEVDLERCLTSEAVLDWIAQIQAKYWGTPACVGDLADALCDLLTPQATLCSMAAVGGTTQVGCAIPPEHLPELVRENELHTMASREIERREAARRAEPDADPNGFRFTNLGDWAREHDDLVTELRRRRDGVAV